MNKKEKDQILQKILESIQEDPLFQKELRKKVNEKLLEHFFPHAYITKVNKVKGEFEIDKFFLEKYNV